MKLVFDTETTGFPFDTLAGTDVKQPHMVQLAMLLCEDSGLILHQVSLLIAAEDWEVSHGAAAIHGFDTGRTKRYGIPEKSATQLFHRFFEKADELIAHNCDFDVKVLSYAYYRYAGDFNTVTALMHKRRYCTMKESTNLCALPSRNGRGYKWPKLEEAYSTLLGKTIKGAHQALPDTLACWELWMYLTGRDKPPPLGTEADHNASSEPAPSPSSSAPSPDE